MRFEQLPLRPLRQTMIGKDIFIFETQRDLQKRMYIPVTCTETTFAQVLSCCLCESPGGRGTSLRLARRRECCHTVSTYAAV